MSDWELCYSPDNGGFCVTVDPTDIVAPAHVRGRGDPTFNYEHPDALEDRPITLHREYNWRQPDGIWRRWCVGFSDGRERVSRAQRACIPTLEIIVFGCAFWPPGARPNDRVRIPAGQLRFAQASFDGARGAWTELPDDEWGELPASSDR